MSAGPEEREPFWFPPASTFVRRSYIPAEVLEPLLRRPAPEADGEPVRSADGPGRGSDPEHPAR
jgi:hypothetical protein